MYLYNMIKFWLNKSLCYTQDFTVHGKEKISMQVHVVKGVLIYAHTHTQVHIVLRILINL